MVKTPRQVVRGGGEKLRRYAIAAGVIATVLICAPLVAAKGPGGGWGKGLLSSSVSFSYVGEPTVAGGYMYWAPDMSEVFMYDFHGWDLDQNTVYYLIYFYTDVDEEPGVYEKLGSMNTADCENEIGVHIKGLADPPDVTEGLNFCLVPDAWMDFGGAWDHENYLIAVGVNLVQL
jgi:hypothetical protein